MKENYSLIRSIIKGIKYTILIILGLLITGFQHIYPNIWNLSIGGLLIIIYDFLKRNWIRKLP